MKIKTAWSTEANTSKAIKSTYNQLKESLGEQPSLIIVYSSILYDGKIITDTLQQLAPHSKVNGGTSCLGVMSQDGFHSADGIGLGLFGLYDPDGDYGVGFSQVNNKPQAAGAAAIEMAIENAGRFGEPPALVWVTNLPGVEEAVIQGIQSVIGDNVPIAGGSTADNTVEGHWQQFANGNVHTDAVVVTAMYPSVATHFSFHSGYSVTDKKGTATKAEGRILHEIDGHIAAEVYNEWTNGTIKDHLRGGNVLGSTTLYPLGRIQGHIGELPYYLLSHPNSVLEDGSLTLFTDIEVGDEIHLMAGSTDSLVTRAGRVAQAALDAGKLSSEDISGALVVYCAGCMLTVQDKMNEVANSVNQALGGKPFIGTFTFGEQGCFVGGENGHGNLMISVVVFGKKV